MKSSILIKFLRVPPNSCAFISYGCHFQTAPLLSLNRRAEERKDISLSVVQKNSPVLISPTRDRARPPGIINAKTSFSSQLDVYEPEYTNVPEPDYSPPPSPRDQRKSQVLQPTDQTQLRKSVINISDIQTSRTDDEAKDSGIYNKVIKVRPDESQQNEAQQSRVSGEYTTNIKVAPGAVNVMPKMNEIPKLRKVDPASRKDDIPVRPQSEANSEQKLSVKQRQENMENIYVNEVKEKTNLSPRTKTKAPAPPPIPSSPRAPPPPPSPGPLSPAPPPPPPDLRMAGGRLKQVHWSRVPKPLVRNLVNGII